MVSNGKKNHKTDTKILNYHNTIQRSRMNILIHFVKKKVRKRLVMGQRNKKKKEIKTKCIPQSSINVPKTQTKIFRTVPVKKK
jgi:hypothetical protein